MRQRRPGPRGWGAQSFPPHHGVLTQVPGRRAGSGTWESPRPAGERAAPRASTLSPQRRPGPRCSPRTSHPTASSGSCANEISIDRLISGASAGAKTGKGGSRWAYPREARLTREHARERSTHLSQRSSTCFFFSGDGFLDRAKSSISLRTVLPPVGVFRASNTRSSDLAPPDLGEGDALLGDFDLLAGVTLADGEDWSSLVADISNLKCAEWGPVPRLKRDAEPRGRGPHRLNSGLLIRRVRPRLPHPRTDLRRRSRPALGMEGTTSQRGGGKSLGNIEKSRRSFCPNPINNRVENTSSGTVVPQTRREHGE